MLFTTQGRVRDFFMAGIAVGILGTAAFAIDNQRTRRHTVTYPPFDPAHASGCGTEANAYAAALVALENATQAADDAYDAWQECDSEQMTPDTMPEPLAKEYSVLVND